MLLISTVVANLMLLIIKLEQKRIKNTSYFKKITPYVSLCYQMLIPVNFLKDVRGLDIKKDAIPPLTVLFYLHS